MSAFDQQKFLRAVGIGLVTMLVLALAQELIQISGLLNAKQIRLLLWLLFPLFAILCGAATRFMIGNMWAALIISLISFTAVILVLFNPATLIYVPGYVLLSLAGYGSAGLFEKKERVPAV
jgi:uncharacterized membrane protein